MNPNRTKLPAQAVRLFQELRPKDASFTRAEAMRALAIKPQYLNLLLYRLERMGWIRRLERGKYLIIPMEAGKSGTWTEHPYVIAPVLVDPYEIAYWSALSHWGYTEQLLKTTFVLTTKRKFNRTIEILGETYRFIRVPERKFFGITQVWRGEYKMNVTDRERTIVDCLDHPEYCGGIVEVSKALREAFGEKQVNLNKLITYAKRLGNRAIFKRLGYLAEVLNLGVPGLEKKCLKEISKGYSKLDPSLSAKGKYNSRWNIIENIGTSELTAD